MKQIFALAFKRIATLHEIQQALSSRILCSFIILSLLERDKKGWFASIVADENEHPAQLTLHESTIVWFLNHRASRLSRLLEEHSNFRRPVRPIASPQTASKIAIEETVKMSDQELAEKYSISPIQMQQLVSKNDALLASYSETKTSLAQAEESIFEISRLQMTLQEQLLFQESQIERLHDEAGETVETVGRANAYLANAAKSQSASVRMAAFLIIFLALFLLLVHLISD